MGYPELESHLHIKTDKEVLVLYTDKLLIDKIKEEVESHITITVEVISKEELEQKEVEWIFNSSMFNVYVSDEFTDEHFTKNSEEYKQFLAHFEDFLKPFKSISEKIASFDEINNYSFAPFTLYYKTHDDHILKFLFDSKDETPDYILMFKEALNTIIEFKSPEENDLKKAILDSYSKKNGYKYLSFIEGTFKVLNPLLEVGKEINDKYRDGKDHRIKKPHIILFVQQQMHYK